MDKLLTLLKLLPTIFSAAIGSVHAIEEGFAAVASATGSTVAAAGEQKAAVMEAGITSVMTAEASIVGAIPVELVAKVFATIRDAAVAAFKKLGIFKSSTPGA